MEWINLAFYIFSTSLFNIYYVYVDDDDDVYL